MSENRRLDDLKRRVQQDPASIAFAALADEYRRTGLFHDAIETCRAGLLRHPAYLSARVTLGRALLEIGEYDEAAAQLEQVVRVAPDNLAAIRALADIHRRRGDSPDSYAAHTEAATAAAEPQPAPAPEPPAASEGRARIAVKPAPALQVESHMAAPAAIPEPAPAQTPALLVPSEEPVPSEQTATPAPEVYVPPIDPVWERLEEFLAAIERAREAVQSADAHPRC